MNNYDNMEEYLRLQDIGCKSIEVVRYLFKVTECLPAEEKVKHIEMAHEVAEYLIEMQEKVENKIGLTNDEEDYYI